VCIRERDIGERDIGERDIGERDIGEWDIGERDIGDRDVWGRDIGERENRDRDIGDRDIGERDSGERDIRETVATCRFNQHLLIHIHIRDVSGSISFWQSWHCRARFLQRHIPQMLQPTEGMSLRSSWSWGRLQGLWP